MLREKPQRPGEQDDASEQECDDAEAGVSRGSLQGCRLGASLLGFRVQGFRV